MSPLRRRDTPDGWTIPPASKIDCRFFDHEVNPLCESSPRSYDVRHPMHRPSLRNLLEEPEVPDLKVRALSVAAQSVGALALGALAIGAVAIGAIAIGRLAIGRARIRRLEIDELVVGKLHVTDDLQMPPKS
jgi:hypothetical protein